MISNYELIVIGAGPGGYTAAIEAAKSGIRTAVIENRDIGGTCLNRGCIPTKTFVHAIKVLDEIRSCEKLGIKVKDVTYDINDLYTRKNEVVEQLKSGIEMLFKKNKIDLIRGRAVVEGAGIVRVLKDGHDLEVDSDEGVLYQSDKILIAAGSMPAFPNIRGLTRENSVTSDNLLGEQYCVPARLVVIGGGVIGIELSTIYNSLGSEVVIFEAADRIVPSMDREISQSLSMNLKKKGVKIYTGAVVDNVDDKDGLKCYFSVAGKTDVVSTDCILVAVGRSANIKGLISAKSGIDIEEGKIVVDKNFETSSKGVYAIGDVVKGGIKLAHVASAQGINVACIIAGKEPPIDLDLVPLCLYTSPEVASIGIDPDEAKALGIPFKTGKAVMSANAKSVIEMADRGFIKLIFDSGTEVLIGAQLLCSRATDMIGELALAIENKLTITDMRRVMKPHPTFSESIGDAIEAALNKQ